MWENQSNERFLYQGVEARIGYSLFKYNRFCCFWSFSLHLLAVPPPKLGHGWLRKDILGFLKNIDLVNNKGVAKMIHMNNLGYNSQ